MKAVHVFTFLAVLLSSGAGAGSGGPDADVVRAAQSFVAGDRTQTLSRGSERIYPFRGDVTPEVICAPLRACSIQLAAGEHPTAVVLGDPGRWMVETPDLDATSAGLVVVKPRQCNTTTNLQIMTTFNRFYHLTLDSPVCGGRDTRSQNPKLPYTSLISFYYPDEVLTQLKPPTPARPAVPVCPEPVEPVKIDTFRPSDLHCNYDWKASRGFSGTPDAICTHRGRTLIYWSADEYAGETPALFGLTSEGKPRQVNYTADGQLYLIGEVMERGKLVLESLKRREIALTFWRQSDGR